jgi:hypothetical protein
MSKESVHCYDADGHVRKTQRMIIKTEGPEKRTRGGVNGSQ